MKTVLLLFGGESSEHEVSIASAKNVARSISPTKYLTLTAYIDREGEWWLVDGVGQMPDIDTPEITLDFENKAFIVGDSTITPDVVFPCLHGKNGEDGVMQALIEKMGIPFVGCGVDASQKCINKVYSKEIAESLGVKIVPYKVHNKGEALPSFSELSADLTDHLFVKPSRAGSSVGAHKASSQEELDAAIQDALLHDDVVLIEASIVPRELEVSILGTGEGAKASPVGEIVPDGEFYSYKSKYDPDSKSAVIIPAAVSSELADTVREQALAIYTALGCEGLSRVDFFSDTADGELYFNEINTMPGFTNISMYPKLWEQAGISNKELMDELLTLALERN